jgi:hypothetical protein
MVTLTNPEREALAVLRAGGSFEDAMAISLLTLAEVMALWEAHGN